MVDPDGERSSADNDTMSDSDGSGIATPVAIPERRPRQPRRLSFGSVSRRDALHLAGALGVGALVSACATESGPTSPTDGGVTGGPGDSSARDAVAAADAEAIADSGQSPDASGNTDAGPADDGVTPDCVLAPEQIEGPFYTDLDLVRRDISEGRAGAALVFRFTIVDAATCRPIEGAEVDIWHADAEGLYSAFERQGDGQNIDTTGQSFLRGVQATDADGVAEFDSIYPGWYPGRTTHIHLKVLVNDRALVTTQLYFPDAVSDEVYQSGAYAARGPKDTENLGDGFGGDERRLWMTVTPLGTAYRAEHVIGVML